MIVLMRDALNPLALHAGFGTTQRKENNRATIGGYIAS